MAQLSDKLEEPVREIIKRKVVNRQLRRDPIFKIFKTSNQATQMSKMMNDKLKQMLYRCDLDRPILMRDKLDFIWGKDADDKIVDQFAVKK